MSKDDYLLRLGGLRGRRVSINLRGEKETSASERREKEGGGGKCALRSEPRGGEIEVPNSAGKLSMEIKRLNFGGVILRNQGGKGAEKKGGA